MSSPYLKNNDPISLLGTLFINRNVRHLTFGHVRLAKMQISLRIRAVCTDFFMAASWISKDAQADWRLRLGHITIGMFFFFLFFFLFFFSRRLSYLFKTY